MTIESDVRYYCRRFPVTFVAAKDWYLFDESGKRYLDFLSGAGSLNFGHTPKEIKRALASYLAEDAPLQCLDLSTAAKREFLRAFDEIILKPRGLAYKVMFTGPTGTNAVEAALKVAVQATKRARIVSFTGSFHGVTTGSLAVSSSVSKRKAAAFPLPEVTFLPYPTDVDSGLETFRKKLIEGKEERDLPAAVIVETVQGEGGVNVPPEGWLRALCALCREHGIVSICDDVQAGCGRTGTFFSFEREDAAFDEIVLSKSIGGGMPLAMVLLRPELDVLAPGAHNGTFRGNQLAFVAGKAALSYFTDDTLTEHVRASERAFASYFDQNIAPLGEITRRGIGLFLAVDLSRYGAETAERAQRLCFENGLIVETCGDGSIVKIMPPLTIPEDVFLSGLDILRDALANVLPSR